ncbi:MAG: protocatechuate 3,4-dioxygenase subunit beta [Bryobacterales bacterium]|nr:protocatechuate 3,4-dioxygenase subunit beta [Bryobacterales bacterium]
MTPERILNPRDWSSQPRQSHAGYKSTLLRSQQRPLVPLAQSLSELTAPVFGHGKVAAQDADLTRNAIRDGEAIGERIVVAGRLLDESGSAIPNALVEVWQANAAGRYVHSQDQHDAPLDPNFLGAGRALTDSAGRYCFTTVRPGAYPWRNHPNAWRPAHIHFSVFGTAFVQRLVTQMYFPGDPLLPLDPIFNATADAAARQRLVAQFSTDLTKPEWALGFAFDIVLRGPQATPLEP